MPDGTTTPTTSSAPKSTNGSIDGALRGLPQAAEHLRDPPDGDAGDVRRPALAPPGDHDVALGRHDGVVDELEVEPAATAEVAAAVQEAQLHALADPAAHDRLGVDHEQHRRRRAGHPQHPSDQPVGVDHGLVGVDAGIRARVDGHRAREGLRGADADDSGWDQRLPERARGAGQAVVLGQAVAVEAGGGDLLAQVGVLGRQGGDLVAQLAAGAEPVGDRGDRAYGAGPRPTRPGRTPRPWRDGPAPSASRCRRGSRG